ncbi:MAG: class I SAM-dependent methyltransferase [Myxococcota bacterium]
MSTSSLPQDHHRRFLNRYYGISKHIYDLTRKYYLFGRDQVLNSLTQDPSWQTLIEMGTGTGRNLKVLHKKRPHSTLGGFDASDEMLTLAQKQCPWGTFAHAFAEDADYTQLFQCTPDRILFSYCLSMFLKPREALENAYRQLAPNGRIEVVDFADLNNTPWFFRIPMKEGLLKTFHVQPLEQGLFHNLPHHVCFGPGRYFLKATLTKPCPNTH